MSDEHANPSQALMVSLMKSKTSGLFCPCSTARRRLFPVSVSRLSIQRQRPCNPLQSETDSSSKSELMVVEPRLAQSLYEEWVANLKIQHNPSCLTNAGGGTRGGGNATGRSQNINLKDLLLGTPGRATHLNTEAVKGLYAMSDTIFGFRPESAWPGAMFQVVLQGPLIPIWQKQKEIGYWLTFGGTSVKAAFYEIDSPSRYSLPDIGTKRYILQCIVPETAPERQKVPVNLSVYGPGGKSLAQSLFLGMFEYKENDGKLITYDHSGDMNYLLTWLENNPPLDVHDLSPTNKQEISKSGEILHLVKQEPIEVPEHQGQFSFGTFNPSQSEGDQQDFINYMEYMRSPENALSNEYLAHLAMTDLSYLGMPTFGMDMKPLEQDISQSSVCPGPVHGQTMMASSQPSSMEFSSQQSLGSSASKGYATINFLKKPEIYGDFNSWNELEKQEGRRIIKFDCKNEGDVIILDCYPIQPHEYREDMFTISCVFWKHNPAGAIQHEFSGCSIFTSVDVINLIAQLMDGHDRVDIKEKNRIRRNLEGLRPQTVRKEGCTLNFFNQLMNYSQPKTRNIEKDIKVFLWRDLSQALRKIISQYMAKQQSAERSVPIVAPVPSFGTQMPTLSENDTQTYHSDLDLSQPLFQSSLFGEVEKEQFWDWPPMVSNDQAEFDSSDPQLPSNGMKTDGGEDVLETATSPKEDEQLPLGH